MGNFTAKKITYKFALAQPATKVIYPKYNKDMLMLWHTI